MSNILNELKAIWSVASFKEGSNAFWLYNYSFFTLLDEKQFKEYNQNPPFPGKLNIATGTTNPDDDEYGLYADTTTGEIFIYAYYKWWNKRGLKKIADSLEQMFGTADITSILVSKKDPDIWEWRGALYYGTDFPMPKGALPSMNLGQYFHEVLRNTVIIHPRGFALSELRDYFEGQGAGAYFPADFFDRYSGVEDWHVVLTDQINTAIGDKQFFAAEFQTGEYGFGNYASLIEAEQRQLDYYGLIVPKS
ncbi:MAG TPA: hypothetical protein VHM26_12640 [Chitinophagaceae bacterium]|jgi:hypothetical protein|nr:hypothetical protein [Chitinophagaceae bacterium]